MRGANAIRMSVLFCVIEIAPPDELPQIVPVTEDDTRQRAAAQTEIARSRAPGSRMDRYIGTCPEEHMPNAEAFPAVLCQIEHHQTIM